MEDLTDLSHRLGGDVEPPLGCGQAGKGYVDGVLLDGAGDGHVAEGLLPVGEPLLQQGLGLVRGGAHLSPLVRRQRGQAAEELGEPAAPPEMGDPPPFELVGVVGGVELLESF